MSHFEEVEFETKTINNDVVKEMKVLYHDTRTGFVGLASDEHKKNNPQEWQEFLAAKHGPDAKPSEEETFSSGAEDEAFEDKHASVPVDSTKEVEVEEGSEQDPEVL